MDPDFGTRGMFLHTIIFDMMNSRAHSFLCKKDIWGVALEDNKLLLFCAIDNYSVSLAFSLSVSPMAHSYPFSALMLRGFLALPLLGVIWPSRLHKCRQWPSFCSCSSTRTICRRRSNGRYSSAACIFELQHHCDYRLTGEVYHVCITWCYWPVWCVLFCVVVLLYTVCVMFCMSRGQCEWDISVGVLWFCCVYIM